MNFGNWYRRIRDLAGCVLAGEQFMIGYESEDNTVTREQWKAACRQLGLYYWLQKAPDLATEQAEALDPFCIGWNHPDEKNDASPTLGNIDEMKADYDRWHAYGKLVMCNYDGSQRWSGFDYKKAYDLPIADVWWFDLYVRNRLGKDADIEATMDEMLAYHHSQGLPLNARWGFFYETDDQLLKEQGWAPNGCGPTPADIDTYFRWGVKNGASAMAAFEDVIGKWFVNYGDTEQAIFDAVQRNQRQYATPILGSLIPPKTVQVPVPPPDPKTPGTPLKVTVPVIVVPSIQSKPPVVIPPATIHQRTVIHLNRRAGHQTVCVYDDASTSKVDE
jgi:hypothetical protein